MNTRCVGLKKAQLGLLACTAAAALAIPATADAKRNVYVSNANNDTVTIFDIGAGGALTQLGAPVPTADYPAGVAMTSDGKRLYVADYFNQVAGAGKVSGYSVAADGSLTEVPGSPFAAGSGTDAVAVDPAGRFLFATNRLVPGGTVSAYSINADGSLTAVPGSPFLAGTGPQALAVSPDGKRLYVANSTSNDVTVYDISATGVLSQIVGSPFAAGVHTRALAFSPDGSRLFVTNRENFVNQGNVGVYDVAADGSITPISGSPFAIGGLGGYGVTISPSGDEVYVPNALGSAISGFDVGAGGTLSSIAGSPFTTGFSPTGLQVTPDGKYMYAAAFGTSTLHGHSVGADGSLTQLPGSPFAAGLGQPAFGSVVITPNQGPTAAFTAKIANPNKPTSFDASGSGDADGTVARYDWTFGDGTSLQNGGSTPTHTFRKAGVYKVTLTVTDNEGCSSKLVFTGQTAHCNGSSAAVAETAIGTPAKSNGSLPQR